MPTSLLCVADSDSDAATASRILFPMCLVCIAYLWAVQVDGRPPTCGATKCFSDATAATQLGLEEQEKETM